MKRKSLIGWIAVLALGAFHPTSALSLVRVRIGSSSSGVNPNNVAIYAAELKGLFKKHGIEVEVIEIDGGAARSVSALVAGDITNENDRIPLISSGTENRSARACRA